KYESSAYWYRKLAETGDKRAANFSDSYSHYLPLFFIGSAQWKIRFTSLNTTFDEFSPVFFKKGLIFTSNRNFSVRNNLISGWDLKPFNDLYLIDDTLAITNFDINKANAPEKNEIKPVAQIQDNRTVGDFGVRGLSGSGVYVFNEKPTKAKRIKGDLRSKFHDGPVSIASDQKSMIFTRNNYYKGRERLSRDGVNRLKLYSASLINEKWSNIKEFEYNSNEYSTAHPALSGDGNLVYFASDMPGGVGGMDLYYSVKQNGKWSRPVNLGPNVNTKSDEIFPFLNGNNELYFSSTGLAGLGGMDIFRTSLNSNLPVGDPVNIGYPVNSSKDDFGIIFRSDGRSGYFSSNRIGNDDIYSFQYNPEKLTLNGLIVNSDRKTPVNNAMVLVKSEGHIDTLKTYADGRFRTNLKKDTHYEVYSLKDGISSEKSTLSTYGKTSIDEITITLILSEAYRAQIAQTVIPAPVQGEAKTEPDSNNRSSLLPSKEAEQLPAVQSTPEIQRVPPVSEKQNILVEKFPSSAQQSTYIPPVTVKTSPQKQPQAEVSPNGSAIKRVVVPMKTVTGNHVSPEVTVLNCTELRKKYYIDNIYYSLNQSYIRNSELPVLEQLIKLMKDNPEIKVIANSHTDALASYEYNKQLSSNRSMVVKRYLVSRGIAEDRIRTEYSGKTRPLIPCITNDCTPKELELNRRTEFYIIVDGRNITLDCN
ncbi:MAG TPA: OmpA family protein, partial [Sphingobacteriaceae bacterium]